ncbi:MAG: ATP-binding protein [Nitrososphaera sp.]
MAPEDASKIKTPLLSEDEILRILYLHNPWWAKKPILEAKLKEFKRRDYYKLVEQLENEKITAVIGARQVGKTTLMYQLIEKLISEVKPQNVFFLSLDDQYLNITLQNLGKIFDLYARNIIKRPLDELKDRVYFFLDEIQAIDNWELMLKRWFDLGYKIKFVISGSSSVSILRGTSEALVGRIQPQVVLPMKFLEYIRFKERGETGELVDTAKWDIRDALKHAITENEPDAFYSMISDASKALSPVKDRILVHLQQYFIKGGYPEVAGIDDPVICAENLMNYLHLTMYKDIMRTGKVRDPSALENLFAILAKESSQRINRTRLARTLDLKRETLNTYIYLLKTAFLISEAEFYSKSRVKRARREKKVYVNDVGIRNVAASAFDDQILTNPSEVGRIVETLVADHTKRLQYNLEHRYFPSLFYWRDTYEVDIVIDVFQKPLPLEVKFRETITDVDLQGLESFNKKFKSPLSLVITKDYMDMKDSTVFIPAWLYLILC